MLKLGIDDAGRGPVIGPMVLAGCLMDSSEEPELKRLGVKDSKQLTQKRREFLEEIIKEKSLDFYSDIINPEEIDRTNSEGLKLNELEAISAAKIINKINNEKYSKEKIKVIIDCPSPSIKKWQDFLKTHVDNLSNLEISCEHKADRNYVVVSAASVLAKTERERQMAILKKKYGEGMGSGYTSDPTTKKFLELNIKKLDKKGIFRKSWKTWKNASSKTTQKKLF